LDPLAAFLMLLAGLLHASWHAMVKTGSGLAILAGMGLVSALLTSPWLFVVPMPSRTTWLIILASLALHAGYKACLAVAYRSAEFGRIYPIARGTVPLFAVVLAYLSLQQGPGPGQIAAILIVSCGVLGLALDRGHVRFDRSGLVGAICAAAMVAGYSVLDAAGTRRPEGWGSFTAWIIVLDSLVFFAVALALRGRKMVAEIRMARRPVVVAGILGLTSFAVFLWALSRNPIANVVAFRECSVLFATLIGVLYLGEPATPRRLACAAAIAAGLMLLAAFKPV
jgi:drug/metabolite transporter (DMT)-like permease